MTRRALALRAIRTRKANNERGLRRLAGMEVRVGRDARSNGLLIVAHSPKYGALWRGWLEPDYATRGLTLQREERHPLLTDLAAKEVKRRASDATARIDPPPRFA